MTEWDDIRSHILHPEYKQVCNNIAGTSHLRDDLYQELMLILLEGIEKKSPSILSAWNGDYIKHYIIKTADNLFHGKYTVIAKQRFVADTTGVPEFVDNYQVVHEHEQENELLVKQVQHELTNGYWYNGMLFTKYALEKKTIRDIAKETGIPRATIHKAIQRTRKKVLDKIRTKPNE